MGFPCGSAGRESAYNGGDLGSSPGLARSPGEGKGYALVFWPGELRGLYSPWGRKESDMTERLSLHFVNLRSTGIFLALGALEPSGICPGPPGNLIPSSVSCSVEQRKDSQ